MIMAAARTPMALPHDAEAPDEAGFGLYVHWPFCRSKCPYCDFNSHVRDSVDESRWRRALVREVDRMAGEAPGRAVTSVFFGGGTPSLMAPATVAAVLDRIHARWPVDPAIEITLEANPTSVEAARLAGLRRAGVNRVSLGVQALDDGSLAALGRGHSRDEALAAVALAARLFDRFSFDLIYGRPGQTVEGWRDELRCALAWAGDHLSVYQLTIEPGTAFHGRAARGELRLPGEDAQAAFYEATQERLSEAGLPAYEISNHARPGCECRHNLTYWRHGEYLGIGPGAHGRLWQGAVRLATRCHRAPEAWLDRVENGRSPETAREVLEPEAQAAEMLMMGLRLAEGVALSPLERIARRPLRAIVHGPSLDRLVRAGFLSLGDDRLQATGAGRQRLNAVLASLLA